jgi:hypothetical protein
MINYTATEFNKLVGNYEVAIMAFMEDIGAAKADTGMISKLFNRQDVDEPEVAITGTSARGDLKQMHGTRNYSDINEYFTKNISFTEFSDTASFGRKFLDDNKLLSMKTAGGSLMEAAARTQENFAGQVFTNADQTSFVKDGDTYTWTLSADGVAFVSNSHTSKSGKNTDYLDNLTTSTLDGDNLETAMTTMSDFTDDTGNDGSYFGDTLLVGMPNAKTALELANSDKKPKVANNEYNVYEGMFEVIVWKKLKKQASKTGAPWHWIDSVAAKENLYFLDRVKPETTSHSNFETLSWAIGVYCRFAIGVYDWKWLVGNIPA